MRSLEDVDAAPGRLSRHCILPRYSDARPGSVPLARCSADDVSEALSDADRVLAWPDGLWASSMPKTGARAEETTVALERVLEGRRAASNGLVAKARRYVEDLARRIPLRTAVVIGSPARGDFNRWSDVDLLVVSDERPERVLDQLTLLEPRAPGHPTHPMDWGGMASSGWPRHSDRRRGRLSRHLAARVAFRSGDLSGRAPLPHGASDAACLAGAQAGAHLFVVIFATAECIPCRSHP